jgi:hypothetical protein
VRLPAAVLGALVLTLPVDRGAADEPPQVDLVLLSPADLPAGSTIFWWAAATGEGPFAYRFRLGPSGGPLGLVRDFSTRSFLEWTPLDEGPLDVEVTARAPSGDTATASATYLVTSRVTSGEPVVSATLHPLVALYTAPPCPPGDSVRVWYAQPGLPERHTPFRPCPAGRGVSFQVAGLLAETTYELRHEVVSGGSSDFGPTLTHRAGSPTTVFPRMVTLDPPDETTSMVEPVVLHSMLMSGAQRTFPVATDPRGAVIWYYDRSMLPWQTGAHLLRPAAGGTMLLAMNDGGVQWQVLREIDLAGNSLRETTVGRVSEQLVDRGEDPITAFHHDALRLPNGHTLVLASVERILVDVQGPGPVDVLGDMIVDLDEDWQVAWSWNAFDHLDARRAAVLGETCTGPADGCRPLRLATRANDWTHANSLAYRPDDGSLVVSLRHQDWAVKIDYADGAGTGAVLWRLGRDGDFATLSDEPWPWFSHQHDVGFDGEAVLLYDNGNARCSPEPLTCQSRGQVLRLDETSRTAELQLNAGLGHYSPLMGSAQRLANGNYHFGSGWVYPGPHSEAIELRPDGTTSFRLATAIAYRSFRMRDIHAP